MELGKRLKQARLEAGLSQRQLCGDEITRNMLSQIENGSARPSMDTLRYLAGRLGKPISFFLEEAAVTSPNQAAMAAARQAFRAGDWNGVLAALEDYRQPDPVFDGEWALLSVSARLGLAETAVEENRLPYARELLERASEMGVKSIYCSRELERRRLLLLGAAGGQKGEICAQLPSLDGELLLRAEAALEAGNIPRAAALLDAAEDQQSSQWGFLRGEVYLAAEDYAAAAACYHRAERAEPDRTAPRLERCYRELEDFKQAYFYACKQREHRHG
ncbi:MAG: helix-turn-helix transcriptional regulator [Oscillospiraceae bacterium]|nr:helix-turn-helix transcriptional regulator [Oscillospiraceae bacterium]